MRCVVYFLPIAVLASGCATITRGTTEQVAIDVEPKDAKVETSIGLSCTAMPCEIKVDRDMPFTVTASKDGYVDQTVEVKTKTSGQGAAAVTGNLIFGGVVGAAIDGYNGAMQDHYPNPVVIKLHKPGEEPAKIQPEPQKSPVIVESAAGA